jgi:phosphoglucosamine mutase
MRLAVDCAHGATYHVAPHVYRELGAEVDSMGDQPDGLNINRDCGSTHMEGLREKVRTGGYDAGIALDGDGDRCLMVTADGSLVDGDQLLYVIARARQRAGALQGPVVGTLMSNLGLELALADAGIAFERARVGDRYVFEMLMNSGGMLGGEASGHTLCLDRASTGDGIVSSLQVLEVMAATGASLAELIAEVRQCPQTLINVPLAGRSADDLMQAQSVMDAVAAEEQSLAASGRVLLRPSGTEPLLRVMVESTDAGASRDAAQRIAAAIETVAAGS